MKDEDTKDVTNNIFISKYAKANDELDNLLTGIKARQNGRPGRFCDICGFWHPIEEVKHMEDNPDDITGLWECKDCRDKAKKQREEEKRCLITDY